MAEGAVHLNFWKKGLPIILALSVGIYFVYGSIPLAISLFLGYLMGYLIDPDLDMPNMTYAKRRWRNTIVFYPVYWYWQMYAWTIARVFGGHRAFMNHFPLVSTSIRFLWMFTPIVVGLLFYYGVPAWDDQTWMNVITYVVAMLAGLTLSDAVHYTLDYI